MADSSLWGVIVGGLIAIGGGFAGPYILQREKDRTEALKKRAEKFEELVAAVFEHKHWLTMARDARVFAEKKRTRSVAVCENPSHSSGVFSRIE